MRSVHHAQYAGRTGSLVSSVAIPGPAFFISNLNGPARCSRPACTPRPRVQRRKACALRAHGHGFLRCSLRRLRAARLAGARDGWARPLVFIAICRHPVRHGPRQYVWAGCPGQHRGAGFGVAVFRSCRSCRNEAGEVGSQSDGRSQSLTLPSVKGEATAPVEVSRDSLVSPTPCAWRSSHAPFLKGQALPVKVAMVSLSKPPWLRTRVLCVERCVPPTT